MTTAAIEMRDSIAMELFSIEDLSLLTSISKSIAKLKATFAAKKQEEYLSKEELLAGIDVGLKELKMGLGRPARDFLNELRQS